jgi:hypothetical protein
MASNTGVIMVVGQKIALGRIYAGQIVTVRVAEDTMTIDLGGEDTCTIHGPPPSRSTASKPTGPARPPVFPRASFGLC